MHFIREFSMHDGEVYFSSVSCPLRAIPAAPSFDIGSAAEDESKRIRSLMPMADVASGVVVVCFVKAGWLGGRGEVDSSEAIAD
jgi:hypothetical protein